MSCEICGRSNCMRSFHSLEAQEEFDNVADKIKERMKRVLANSIQRLDGYYDGDVYYIKLDDVLNEINDY